MFVRVCVCYDITVVLVKHCVSCHDDSDVGQSLIVPFLYYYEVMNHF